MWIFWSKLWFEDQKKWDFKLLAQWNTLKDSGPDFCITCLQALEDLNPLVQKAMKSMQNGRIKRTLVQSFFRMHLGMLIRHWFSALHIFTGSSQILNFSEVLRLENAVKSFQSWVQFQNHSMIFWKERLGLGNHCQKYIHYDFSGPPK